MKIQTMKNQVSRRRFVAGAAVLVTEAMIAAMLSKPKYSLSRKRPRSRVAILHCDLYSEKLENLIGDGLALFDLQVQGKRVLLKPNLVDYISGIEINTHPLLVAAVAESFRRLGAKSVTVGEGPGHQRDTQLVLWESGFQTFLRDQNIPFVDLNRDELFERTLAAQYTPIKRMWLPRSVLEADFVVSIPKIKTHRWSGVTLSMKNMFGIVPGEKYGWPKNILHCQGIQPSILDICTTIPVHFVVADGIVAMEGLGPLNGTARSLNRLVLSDDPVAADATCARLMGLVPERIPHIRVASEFLGNSDLAVIDQLAESLDAPAIPFQTVPDFEYLRKTTPRRG